MSAHFWDWRAADALQKVFKWEKTNQGRSQRWESARAGEASARDGEEEQCVCVCLSISVFACFCACISVSVCLCVWLCVCVCVSLCVWVSMCLCLLLCVWVYVCLCVSESACVCVCLGPWVCLCVHAGEQGDKGLQSKEQDWERLWAEGAFHIFPKYLKIPTWVLPTPTASTPLGKASGGPRESSALRPSDRAPLVPASSLEAQFLHLRDGNNNTSKDCCAKWMIYRGKAQARGRQPWPWIPSWSQWDLPAYSAELCVLAGLT